ncbi:P-loop containing nucleoside triphosphate hydrolase protein [Hyaloraphidium curvatum]|nr:P-loop containing nucleoside triphosphate hydrolase protein [Hyaloraphidium curvatum]
MAQVASIPEQSAAPRANVPGRGRPRRASAGLSAYRKRPENGPKNSRFTGMSVEEYKNQTKAEYEALQDDEKALLRHGFVNKMPPKRTRAKDAPPPVSKSAGAVLQTVAAQDSAIANGATALTVGRKRGQPTASQDEGPAPKQRRLEAKDDLKLDYRALKPEAVGLNSRTRLLKMREWYTRPKLHSVDWFRGRMLPFEEPKTSRPDQAVDDAATSQADLMFALGLPSGGSFVLKSWQAEGARKLAEKLAEAGTAGSMLLCDGPGLGKSATALATALALHRSHLLPTGPNGSLASSGIILIICPASVLESTWVAEITNHTGFAGKTGGRIFVYLGPPRDRNLRRFLLAAGYGDSKTESSLDGALLPGDPNRVLFVLTTAETLAKECSLVRAHRSGKRKGPMDYDRLAGEGEDSLVLRLNYTAVIFDEIHRAKGGPEPHPSADAANPAEAAEVSNTWLLMKLLASRQRVIGLTGTPIPNAPRDLANLAKGLGWRGPGTSAQWLAAPSEGRTAFISERILRRAVSREEMGLPDITVQDVTVPFTTLEGAFERYAAQARKLNRLASSLA